MQPEILWQDENIAVLQKPAGMVVNTADSVKSYTVQEWAREQWSQEEAWQESLVSDIFAEREGMVHMVGFALMMAGVIIVTWFDIARLVS